MGDNSGELELQRLSWANESTDGSEVPGLNREAPPRFSSGNAPTRRFAAAASLKKGQ